MSRKRIRAHANPLSDVDIDWPLTPDAVPWNQHYPAYLGPGNVPTALATAPSASSSSSTPDQRAPLAEVRIADIGCGFGGMSVALSEIFPDKLVLGLEIRDKVVDIVKERIDKLRKQAADNAAAAGAGAGSAAAASASASASSSTSGFLSTNSASPSPAPWFSACTSYAPGSAPFTYQNVSVVKTNIMKFAPNYFRRGQLDSIFILFADPHFKKSNHRRRVISANFLAIYAYILKVGGLIYTITDVKDLHEWEVSWLDKHPLFERIPNEELANDAGFIAMHHATEEGQKVTRLSGQKYPAVFRRIAAKERSEE